MELLRELMNFDSFWTLWFWITHAVAWSLASHFAMGVPHDTIVEANRENTEDGPWARAAEAMILAQVFRFTTMARRYGALLTGFSAFLLSALLTLGILADLEFARALCTLLIPLTLIYALTIRTAERIDARAPRGRALRDVVRRQRLVNQLVGLLGLASAIMIAVWQFTRSIASWGL